MTDDFGDDVMLQAFTDLIECNERISMFVQNLRDQRDKLAADKIEYEPMIATMARALIDSLISRQRMAILLAVAIERLERAEQEVAR